MPEIWRDIPGYEGRYQASTMGRIQSVDHFITVSPKDGKAAYTRLERGRILQPATTNDYGHLAVALWKDGQRKTLLVHQLVMLTFRGAPPDNCEVRHLNGNKVDNRLANLEYGTRAENQADMYRYGSIRANGKLTIDDVIEVKRRLAAGEKQTSIAREFGVSQTVVSNIKLGRAWYWLDNFLSTSRPSPERI